MDWPTVALIAVIILAAVAFAWMALMIVVLRHTKKMQDKITADFAPHVRDTTLWTSTRTDDGR